MAQIGKASVRVFPRSYKKGDEVTVKTRVFHPQVNGRVKNQEGLYPEPFFINEIKVFYGDEMIMEVKASAGLSVNPFFNFTMKATRSAPLKMVWKDNQGKEYSEQDEIKV
ncbi:MAG: thiosulfate oxidation carrier complex protein SoxZ [Deltaproteobacteria bacterium]|nr:thiosulfate oxidation carrier complex protein SoxZ [Deltaproteobacteria bacterium]